MGADDERRHAWAIAGRAARRVVPRIANELCRAEHTRTGAVRIALGLAIVLSRFQSRRLRAARNRSVRGHHVTTMSSTRSRHTPLALDAETFRTLGHRLVDQLAEQLAAVPTRPVTPDATPA